MKYRIRADVSLAILLTTVLSLTVASCGQTGSKNASDSPKGDSTAHSAANSPESSWSSRSVYAFQDDHTGSYYVANGSKVLYSLKGWTPPVFSGNGRYAISSDNKALYLYDLQTGIKYSRPFTYVPNCFNQFVVGGINDKYVYVADPNLVRYTLPGFTHGVPVSAHLPRGPVCPIGDIGDNVLVLVGADKGWELYEVSSDGASRHLGQDPLWTVNQASPNNFFVGTARAANGDPSVAYDYWSDKGFLVRVLDLRSNTTFDTDDAKLGLPLVGRNSASNAYIEDLWWSRDGHLYAIMSSYSKKTVLSPQHTWRLEGREWIAQDSRVLVSDRPLDNGTSIVLTARRQGNDPDTVGIYGGKLYLQTPSGQEKLVWKHAYDSIIIPSGEAGNFLR